MKQPWQFNRPEQDYHYEAISDEVQIKESNNDFAWNITSMPGCAPLLISHNAWVNPEKRGFGIGQQQHDRRIEEARKRGAKCMMCTIRSDNKAQRHILPKHGWKMIHQFPRDDYFIQIWVIDLGQEPVAIAAI